MNLDKIQKNLTAYLNKYTTDQCLDMRAEDKFHDSGLET